MMQKHYEMHYEHIGQGYIILVCLNTNHWNQANVNRLISILYIHID
jgi:hypothetical protein